MINLSLYHIFKDKFDYLSFKNNRKVTISLLFFRLSLFSWLMHVSMLIFSNSKLGPAEMRNKDMQWWVCFFHTFFFFMIQQGLSGWHHQTICVVLCSPSFYPSISLIQSHLFTLQCLKRPSIHLHYPYLQDWVLGEVFLCFIFFPLEQYEIYLIQLFNHRLS